MQRVETKNKDGVTLFSIVGMTTHKVYDTSYGRNAQVQFEKSKRYKQEAIELLSDIV